MISDNWIRELNNGFYLSFWNSCGAGSRTTDNILINKNLVGLGQYLIGHFSSGINSMTAKEGQGGGGTAPDDTLHQLENLTLASNIFYNAGNFKIDLCLNFGSGNDAAGPPPGTITIVGNLCTGAKKNLQLYTFYANPSRSFVVFNNIFDAPEAGSNSVEMSYAPTTLTSGYNTYIDPTTIRWKGVLHASYAAFIAAEPTQNTSVQCPTIPFKNPANLDYSLPSTDVCAYAKGTNISAYTTTDFLGKSRLTSTPSIGPVERN